MTHCVFTYITNYRKIYLAPPMLVKLPHHTPIPEKNGTSPFANSRVGVMCQKSVVVVVVVVVVAVVATTTTTDSNNAEEEDGE